MAGIISALSDSYGTYAGSSQPPPCETGSSTLWWLLINAERLLLCPNPNNTETIDTCVSRRLKLFRCGHIETLWSESLRVSTRPPGSYSPSTNQRDKAAQDAVDKDSYKVGYTRGLKPSPIAIINSTTLPHAQKLYPSRLPDRRPNSPPPPQPTTRQNLSFSNLTPLRGDIIRTIRRAPKGKANGMSMDSLDMFVTLVKLDRGPVHQAIRHVFTRIFNGDLPPAIVPYFNDIYLFLLHKDPDDPSKLRPIGIPSALRRLICSHVAKSWSSTFARHLLPFNWAVGIDNGMDFAVRVTQLLVERYITGPQSKGDAPSRVLLSLDIVNMFNELSREEIFVIIERDFPDLLPLVRMLYNEPGQAWLRTEDGTWTSIGINEGLNQGCPLSSILAALVLHSILDPITKKLHARACDRRFKLRPMDDNIGGESTPVSFVDDCNIAIHVEDLFFFFVEWHKLAPQRGVKLNVTKTSIMTSTNGHSALPSIARDFGPAIAAEVRFCIDRFSTKLVPDPSNPSKTMSVPHEETKGLRILGQPVGSYELFGKQFILDAFTKAETEATKLPSIFDKHSSLRLFQTCSLSKTPHLLASEVAYSMNTIQPQHWDNWTGPLATNIDSMANSFLAKLIDEPSLPLHSMLIAYIPQNQGGLGLLDAATRAIPDFVLTMTSAYRYATDGITLGRDTPPVLLPPSLTSNFSPFENPSSDILHHFRRFLPDIATVAAPPQHPDPITFLLHRSRPNSARDYIKKEAGTRRRAILQEIAPPDLRPILHEILFPATSYPIIGMSRSIKSHRRPDHLLCINLRQKLHLDQFRPSDCPTCLCGKPIDPRAMHTFCCRRISKIAIHHRIRDGIAQPIHTIAATAGIISKSSKMRIEPRGLIPHLPGLRPLDLSWCPTADPTITDRAPVPFAEVGIDVTITSPQGYAPPSDQCANIHPAESADFTHLLKKERAKLCRERVAGTTATPPASGDEILRVLYESNRVLVPMAISPNGYWGPMFDALMFGHANRSHLSIPPLTFPATRPFAARMYRRAMSHECPTGITNIAHKRWLASKPKHQQYFGNSHTSPTCKTYLLQKLGLVISNAIAIHINDAKNKKLPPAADSAPPPPTTAATATAPPDPAYDPISDLLAGPVPDPTKITLAELFRRGFSPRFDTSQRSPHLLAVPSPVATTPCPPNVYNTRSRNNP